MPASRSQVPASPPPPSVTVSRAQLTVHQGPLPPPEQLAAYNDVIPNGAERLFKQFERQSSHRIAADRYTLETDARHANWGVAAGFLIGMTGLVGSVAVILAGHDQAGWFWQA